MEQAYAKDYVHRESVGDPSACRAAAEAAGKKLVELYKAKRITVYQVNVIRDINDVRFQILTGGHFEEVTQGRYPFVFALVQARRKSGENLGPVMEGLGFAGVSMTEESSRRFAEEVTSHLALLDAAREGDLGKVEDLLAAGRYVQIQDDDRRTPLHVAVEGGHAAVVGRLLASGADADAEARHRWRPLHLAVRSGHMVVVKALLEAKADVDAATEDAGETALHMAARLGDEEAMRALLDAGADTEAKNADGETAHQLAAKNSFDGAMRLLRERGAQG